MTHLSRRKHRDCLTLVDFGIAWAADSTRLTVTQGIGTLEYMAPETFDESLARPDADDHTLGADVDLHGMSLATITMPA